MFLVKYPTCLQILPVHNESERSRYSMHIYFQQTAMAAKCTTCIPLAVEAFDLAGSQFEATLSCTSQISKSNESKSNVGGRWPLFLYVYVILFPKFCKSHWGVSSVDLRLDKRQCVGFLFILLKFS